MFAREKKLLSDGVNQYRLNVLLFFKNLFILSGVLLALNAFA